MSYKIITQNIIEQLENCIIPWQKPWQTERPRNIQGRPYRGINLLLLSYSPYSCPVWATFRQIRERGGSVKKGEKGTMVVFWSKKDYQNSLLKTQCKNCKHWDKETGHCQRGNDQWKDENWERKVPCEDFSSIKEDFILKYYKVFNLEQTTLKIEDYWKPSPYPNFQPIEQAESIIENMPNPPDVAEHGDRAYYDMGRDLIVLPPRSAFKSAEGYYSTYFHELVHSTGHQKRLNRKSLTDSQGFGDNLYSREELIAEIGAAFLCAECGLDFKVEDTTAYIKSWLKKFNDDKKMVVIAASQAQKAVEYILNQ